MGNSIFDALSKPGVLNAQGARLPNGRYLCEVEKSFFAPGKRSGDCYVIEFRVIAGASDVGGKFSSVPKVGPNTMDVTLRELADFIAACEGDARGMQRYANPDGSTNQATLKAEITRAFHTQDSSGEFTNPYKGARVFVTAEKRTSSNNREYVQHRWSFVTEELARAAGFQWPPLNPATQAIGGVTIPPAGLPRGPVPAPVAPPAYVPPAPSAAPPGWEDSPTFPGWYGSPVGGPHTRWYNPSTGQTIP